LEACLGVGAMGELKRKVSKDMLGGRCLHNSDEREGGGSID
jgi:hypothetical protein